MISNTLSCSSFASTKCSSFQEQGYGVLRRNLKFKPLACLVTKFPASKTFKNATLAVANNKTNINMPLYNRKNSLTVCSYSPSFGPLEGALVPADTKDHSTSSWKNLSKNIKAFYRFCRPYTVIGTIVGVSSISLLPLQSLADLTPTFFVGVLKALIPLMLINIYMVVINQLSDIDIDKVNKPDLPLASGEFSITFALAVTAFTCIMSFAMAFAFKSPPLLYGICAVFLFATAYSLHLPLLRWKNSAILSSFVIIVVRALVVPVGVFVHIQKYVLGRPAVLPRSVLFTVAFMTIIAIVMAVIKDIPDEDGDKAYGIESLTMRIGKEKVFWYGVSALLMAYGMAIVVGATSAFLPSKIITVLGHSILAANLWLRTRSVEISEPSSTLAFYLYVWKLLYVEYLLIPFVR